VDTKEECIEKCRSDPKCEVWLWHPPKEETWDNWCRTHGSGVYYAGEDSDVISGKCEE